MYTDEGKVSQILRNFISNAIKFTPSGEVRISATPGPNETIVFSVKDTGIGIALEDQELVFKEFTQIESAIQDRVKGTGLGLPLCRNLAELMGGTVSLESAPGKGSTFFATIPQRYKATTASDDQKFQWRLTQGKIPVLIIEDNRETAFILGSYLHKTEFEAVTVGSIEQANKVLEQVTPAVIVLDIYLSEENRADYIQVLKASPQSRDIPVIAMSMMDEGRRSFSYGASAFLQKPVDQEEFCSAIQSVAGRSENIKILLVDDNEVSRYVLRERLSAWHFKIIEARSGREGLQLVEREKPNLVILDLLMPDMSGFQVLEELRATPHLAGIPVIIHTSKDLTKREAAFLRDQAVVVLPKQTLNDGVSTERLSEVLEQAGILLTSRVQYHG